MELLRNRSLWFKVLIGLVIVGILAIYPSNYYLTSPGMAESLDPMIDIQADTYQQTGDIMLTAVSMKTASLLEYLYVKLFNPDLRELQSKNMLPSDMNMEKYFEFMQEVMKESQLKAKAVALKEAGYQPQITGEGAKVEKVLEEGNAQGQLQSGDIIVAVDGQQVGLITEVINQVQARAIGDEVSVTVKRDGEQKKYSIKTKSLEQNSNQPSIGVLISSHNRQYDFPMKINIDAGKIGGPSAGSMFALQIFNSLTKQDLTQGYKITGTGTINLKGEIGRIDGVKQKIATAKEQGAKVFFSPQANYQQAKQMTGQGVKIVPVETFSDIINYLQDLK